MNYVANVMNTSSADLSFSAVIFPNAEGFSLLLDEDSAVKFFDEFSSLDKAKAEAITWFNNHGVPVTRWK